MSRRFAARIAWSLWAVAVVLGVGELAFSTLYRDTDVEGSYGPLLGTVFVLLFLVFPTVGALVASRRPGNPIGWLLLSAGVLFGLQGLAEGYGVYALYTAPGALPGGVAMAWVTHWIFIPPLFATPALLFLLFPDGHLPSRRWRPIAWLAVVAPASAALGAAVSPGPLGEPPFAEVVNPLGLEGVGGLDALSSFGWVGSAVAVVAAAASMALRLHRARGLERQQLKWIASAAAVFAVACASGVATFYAGGDDLGPLLVVLPLPVIPIAAGIAILRHRLYDIDVVINRTLVYGALTATLGLAYVGGVLVLGQLFAPLTRGSDLAIAGSTLAVAALFRPLRTRIQAAVDRRFFRRRYNAARTLEHFSVRLREQVDLDALGGELEAVVRETVAPAHVSLWLRAPVARP